MCVVFVVCVCVFVVCVCVCVCVCVRVCVCVSLCVVVCVCVCVCRICVNHRCACVCDLYSVLISHVLFYALWASYRPLALYKFSITYLLTWLFVLMNDYNPTFHLQNHIHCWPFFFFFFFFLHS